jgi:hypothetical protein
LEKGGLALPTSHLEILAPPPGTEVPIKWRPPGSLDILWALPTGLLLIGFRRDIAIWKRIGILFVIE